MMSKFILAIGLVGLILQNPVGTAKSKFALTVTANSLVEAQGYTYRYYLDGSTNGQILGLVQCSGANSPFECTAPIPSFTPGTHSITFTVSNAAGESAKSSPFVFDFVTPPLAITNVRLIG